MTSRKIDRLEIRKDEGQRRNCNLVNNEPRENHASSTFSPMIAVRRREKLADKLLDARMKKYTRATRVSIPIFFSFFRPFVGRSYFFCRQRNFLDIFVFLHLCL